MQPGSYHVCDRCMKWLTLAIAAHSTRNQRNIRNFVGSLHFDSASPWSLDPLVDHKPFCSHRKGYRCSCPSFLEDKRMRECVYVCVCVCNNLEKESDIRDKARLVGIMQMDA